MLTVSTWSFHAGDRLQEPDFLPPRLKSAFCHDFLRKLLQKLLQDVDLQRCSTALSFSSGISWTTRLRNNGLKKRWLNSMACSFLCFISPTFLYMGAFEVYCSWCRSQ
jgi:hypothetical protein